MTRLDGPPVELQLMRIIESIKSTNNIFTVILQCYTYNNSSEQQVITNEGYPKCKQTIDNESILISNKHEHVSVVFNVTESQ